MVRINRITRGVDPRDGPRQARDLQSRQLDQGPHGRPDDRGRRAAGSAQAGRHDHRRHLGQHRHGPRDRRRRQGLQVHLHDDRQAVEGEGRRAEGVRRRGHRLPDQRRSRGSAVVLLGLVAPREGGAELVEGEPVRQPVEHRRALRADRAGDLGTDRRPRHAPGRRRRHRRHDQRRRALPQGAEPAHQGVGHRHLRVGLQEVQGDRHLRQERDLSVHHRGHRRGLPAEERRLRRHRSFREGHRQGRGADDAAHRARGGHLRRQLRRLGDGRAAAAQGPLHGRRRGRGDLPRSRVALSREDVQRRMDAREGLHREVRPDGARSRRVGPVRRAAGDRRQRAGRDAPSS